MQVSRYDLIRHEGGFLVTLRVLTESSGIRSGIVVTMTPFRPGRHLPVSS